MEKTTILIADDHTLVRETWAQILNSDERFEVVGETGTGEDTFQQAKHLRPKIVIMDINMPGMNGIDATELIHKYAPDSKVLCVSLHTQPTYARKMMQKGARGYVTKTSSREEMFHAILEIGEGRKYICDEIRTIIAKQANRGSRQFNMINTLSHREIEIISFVRKGFSSKEIANELNISIKTVEVHRYNILRKLELKNAAALVNFINNNQFEFESDLPS